QDVAENVEDRLRRFEMRKTAAVQSGVTVAVVDTPLVRVTENGVGLGGFLEALRRFRVARVAVRMVLEGKRAIGFLDLVLGGALAHAQDLVKARLGGHTVLPDPNMTTGRCSPLAT